MHIKSINASFNHSTLYIKTAPSNFNYLSAYFVIHHMYVIIINICNVIYDHFQTSWRKKKTIHKSFFLKIWCWPLILCHTNYAPLFLSSSYTVRTQWRKSCFSLIMTENNCCCLTGPIYMLSKYTWIQLT